MYSTLSSTVLLKDRSAPDRTDTSHMGQHPNTTYSSSSLVLMTEIHPHLQGILSVGQLCDWNAMLMHIVHFTFGILHCALCTVSVQLMNISARGSIFIFNSFHYFIHFPVPSLPTRKWRFPDIRLGKWGNLQTTNHKPCTANRFDLSTIAAQVISY